MTTTAAKARKAEYDRERQLADPERKRAAGRAYYAANRERIQAQHRAWVAANPERVAALTRAWRARDLQASRARDREYYAANREKFAATRQRYRAARRQGGDLTERQWADILDEFGDACAYCHRSDVAMEMEHMTPLSRGGLHTKDNVVPACGSCNRRKGRLTALEFLGRSNPSRKVTSL